MTDRTENLTKDLRVVSVVKGHFLLRHTGPSKKILFDANVVILLESATD